jgi:hypothetical protein
MIGVLVASTVVTLLQWWRLRDRRLLPLVGLFAMMAAAHSLESWHAWRDRIELVGIACGLALLPMVGGRGPDAAPRP